MCGTPQIKFPMTSSLQRTLILHTREQNLNQKLLGDNGRCKAAKKKFAHMPAGSWRREKRREKRLNSQTKVWHHIVVSYRKTRVLSRT